MRKKQQQYKPNFKAYKKARIDPVGVNCWNFFFSSFATRSRKFTYFFLKSFTRKIVGIIISSMALSSGLTVALESLKVFENGLDVYDRS